MSVAAIFGLVKAGASYWREILIGLLALGLLWYRGEYRGCVADRAEAIIAAQKKADALSNELVIAQAQAMAVTEKKVVEYVTQIRNVPGDPNCPADERDRAGSRGVRSILGDPKTK